MSVRVVVVEEQGVLREGLGLLLEREGCEVVAATGDPGAASLLVQDHRPDVALIDVVLPGESGVELTRRLVKEDLGVAVLLYAGPEDVGVVRRGLEEGARGCALRQGSARELAEAIKDLAQGRPHIDPRLRPAQLAGPAQERALLSPREREILQLLASGLTGQEAATKLFISPETVRTHVRNAMEKLEAHTRTHAVTIALQRGEISVD